MSEENSTPDIAMPDLSEAIKKLTEHPELLSMAASVLGKAPPTPPPEPSESVSAFAPAPSPDILTSVIPAISKISALRDGGGTSFKHEKLLLSLKPYLSPSRCDAIDYIIKISKMSALVGTLNLK